MKAIRIYSLLIFIFFFGCQNTIKSMEPQYSSFKAKWLKDENRSYYTLLGIPEKADVNQVKKALDEVYSFKYAPMYPATEKAVVQELYNAHRLLTTNDQIKKAYDDNLKALKHIAAKDKAIAALLTHQIDEGQKKNTNEADQYYRKKIVELLMLHEVKIGKGSYKDNLYDPAYNANIVDLFAQKAKQYAEHGKLDAAINVIDNSKIQLTNIYPLIRKTKETIDKVYSERLQKTFTQKMIEYGEKITVGQRGLERLKTKYKKQQKEPKQAQQLTSKLGELNSSLQDLETTLKPTQ